MPLREKRRASLDLFGLSQDPIRTPQLEYTADVDAVNLLMSFDLKRITVAREEPVVTLQQADVKSSCRVRSRNDM